jgi:hypothetical protein
MTDANPPTLKDWLEAGGPAFLGDYHWSYFDTGLGLCGCGDPETALALIRDALDAIETYDHERLRELLPHEPSRELIYHWFDDRGWTDHGSSVPGFLTDAGREAIKLAGAVLRIYEAGEENP